MPRSTLVVVLLLAGGTVASCGDDDVPGDVSPATVLLDESSDTSTGTASTSEVEASPSTAVATMTEITAGPTTPATEPRPETSTSSPGGDVRTMASFSEAGAVDGWSNIDDTVMGGVSASTTSWQAGQLVFAGDLSLENNGGFTSVRSPQDPTFGSALDGASAIALTAEGDGKTYVLQLRTSDDLLYITRFTTVDGELETQELPLDGFEPVTRFLDPAPDAPPLDAGTVVQLAIYLLDGQTGAFRLAVSAIDAVGPGQA